MKSKLIKSSLYYFYFINFFFFYSILRNLHSESSNSTTTAAIEGLSLRLSRVEGSLLADESMLFNHGDNMLKSPHRHSSTSSAPTPTSSTKNLLIRIRKLEDNLLEVQSNIKENEIDIQQVKTNLMSLRTSNSTSNSATTTSSSSSSSPVNVNEDIKMLEKKLKKLAESTTKACRSLSSGLSDVQQASLTLYSWTDKAHQAIDKIAETVKLPSNLCPRAKIPSSNNRRKNIGLEDFF